MYKIKKELRKHIYDSISIPFDRTNLLEWEDEIRLGTVPEFTKRFIHVLPCNKTKQEWDDVFEHPTDPIHSYYLNSLTNIDWGNLSTNPLSITLLETRPHKINWHYLSINPSALHLLKRNIDKIEWNYLCWNPNPESLQLIMEHTKPNSPNKTAYFSISFMKNNHIMYDLDYEAMAKRMGIFKEELLQKALHPKRVKMMVDMMGEEDDLESYI